MGLWLNREIGTEISETAAAETVEFLTDELSKQVEKWKGISMSDLFDTYMPIAADYLLRAVLAIVIFLIGRMRGNAMIGLFLAVTVAALIAELQARIRRTPVLVMEVPLLVPLIPGGDLYRMTVSIMKNGIQASLGAFVWLVQEVFIIAAGVICVQTVVTAVVKLQRSRRHTESSIDQS